ncbi:hypothetical protein RclHR1_05020011 [Rhizophagus clarus]|uniref:High mobility group box domain-containing protein n=1 Tax=Rhizophagus clarus TaxID=94130 RepID=A0A2Z6RLK6_9GLOM|nr:hypothetical protein RclHR1_05020011 [Rhizophagus clarus]GET04294.1 high mobility group box domain-containing protein [Rhizophagus clarus]
MPKIKSDKLPSSISSSSSSHFIPLQSAPVAPDDDISSKLNEILVFPNKTLLNEEENLLINDPPYKLTLSLKDLLSPARKVRKNRNKFDDKIPRPQNAWVLFRKDYEASQRANFPDKALKMKNVSTDAGEVWRNHSVKVKRYFETLSRLAHAQHKILYPNYKYNPKKKSFKETIPKDWIFKDVKQSVSLETSNVEEDQESFVPFIPYQQKQQSESPLLNVVTSPEESWNSPIIINSPISPSTNFVSPTITSNDLELYYSSVTSILTYSEETLANLSSSSSSEAYYNYQQNFTSNLNDLNQSNSDYQPLINLTNSDDTVFINDDMINQNFWQHTSTFSDTQHNCDVLMSDNLMAADLSSYDDDVVHYFY